FSELKKAKIKAVVDHEYRHRYNVGEFAASLLQSLAQAGEERPYLPIEIAGKRFPARVGGRRRLAGEPHGAAALGHYGLRISMALREICLDEAALRRSLRVRRCRKCEQTTDSTEFRENSRRAGIFMRTST